MGAKHFVILGLGLLATHWAAAQQTVVPQSAQPVRLQIAAQPMTEALAALAAQTGVQMIFPASEVAKDLGAPAVNGLYTPSAALKILLEDSGLREEWINEQTVAIRSANRTEAAAKGKASAEVSNRPLILAQAQTESQTEGTTQSAEDKSAYTLEEITVTAERRVERSQDVPISMSVFSRDFIKQYISDAVDVSNFTPNYQLTITDGLSNNTAALRGLGNTDRSAPTLPSSILTYYDGIAAAQGSFSSIPPWDLDRIEVQRGPQGTLYGRNAVGGAVQYFSAAPTEEFEGYGQFTVGEFDLRRFEGAVGGPITEKVKGRVSSLSYDRRGDVTSTLLNTKQGDKDWWGVRGIVDWEVADNFDVRVKGQHFEGDGGAVFFNVAQNNLLSSDQQAWLAAVGADPDLSLDSNFERNQSGLQDPYELLDVNLAELDLNYDFGPMALTLIGGYVDSEVLLENEQGGYPAPIFNLAFGIDTSQVSGELRLTSKTDHPLQWIAGAYYQHTENVTKFGADLTALLRDLDGDGLTRHNADSPEDLLDGLIPAIPGAGNIMTDGWSNEDLETYAFFLHTTYDWTDRFTTTHAARFTHEELNVDYQIGSEFEFPVSFGVTPGTLEQHNDFVRFANLTHAQRRQQAVSIINDPNTLDASGNVVPQTVGGSWDEVTWRFGADYRLTDDALVYSSISRGFKGGMFLSNFADPETSIVYELGAKSQWFDNRLQINVSGFYNDHSDFQTFLRVQRPNVAPITTLENLPKSEIYGGEIEVQIVPMKNLFVAANLGVTETEITDAPPGNEAIVGNALPGTEDMNVTGLVRYDVPSRLGTFSPQLSWRYRGEYWSRKENDDITGKVGGFWTADLRLGYESMDGKLYGLFYCKNVFNEVQVIRTALALADWGTTISVVNERRNWGITMGYRF